MVQTVGLESTFFLCENMAGPAGQQTAGPMSQQGKGDENPSDVSV